MPSILAKAPAILAMMLAGCTGTVQPPPPGTQMAPSNMSAVPQPSQTLVPVASSPTANPSVDSTLTPSPIPTTIATERITPAGSIIVNCIEVTSEPASVHIASEGVVVLDSVLGFDTLLMDMGTGVTTSLALEDHNLVGFAVTPDRNLVAYGQFFIGGQGNEALQDKLVISTASGSIQGQIPWENGWVDIAGWLDNERLVMNIAGESADENRAVAAATLLVLNTVSQERQRLAPEYPDIYDLPPVPNWDDWGETVYDPLLSHVVYLRWLQPGSTYAYALWDRQQNQMLASLQAFDHTRTPRWSPDGRQVAIAANLVTTGRWLGFELYLLNRDDGKISQVTDLARDYAAAYIQSYSWSPGGQQIAFWLNEAPTSNQAFGEQHLAIVNTTTAEITNYCVPGDFATARGPARVPPPLWSPSGEQLLVQNRYGENESRIILVDIAHSAAVQISENMVPVGWMNSKP